MKKYTLLLFCCAIGGLSIAQEPAPLLPHVDYKPPLPAANGGQGNNLLHDSLSPSYTPGISCRQAAVNDSLPGRKTTSGSSCFFQLSALACSGSGRKMLRGTWRGIVAKDYGQPLRTLKTLYQPLPMYGLQLPPEQRMIEQLAISDRQINL